MLFYIVFFFLLVLLLIWINKKKEPFVWSDETKCNYEKYVTFFPDNRFNLNVMQQNASEDEVKHLFEYNKYPWSQKIKDIYLDNVSHNKITNIQPNFSLLQNQKIYPEKAITQKLSYNTKEGDFLLYGSVLPSNKNNNKEITLTYNDNIKCNFDKNGTSFMEYTHNEPYQRKTKKLNNEELEEIIPGFSFVNGTCNPCSPLEDTPQYNCPFTLNKKGDTTISPIWKLLWNIN